MIGYEALLSGSLSVTILAIASIFCSALCSHTLTFKILVRCVFLLHISTPLALYAFVKVNRGIEDRAEGFRDACASAGGTSYATDTRRSERVCLRAPDTIQIQQES